jgi:MFS family permease
VTPASTASPGTRRLFTPSYLLAIVALHFYFVSYFMSLVEVPKSLAGQPDWVVGVVVGMLGLAGMFARPLVGVWVDVGNRQRWLRLGAAATVVAFLGYALRLDPWLTIPFRALHGVGMALFTTSLLAIVTSMLPHNRRGLGVGIYQSSNTMSGLYSAAVAIWLIAVFSFELAFLISAAAAGLALLFGAMAGDPAGAEARALRAREPERPRPPRQWISRTALLPALVFFSLTTPFGALNAFLPLFADERSLGNVGLFYTVLAAAQLVTRSGSGLLSDRFGRASVLVPALVAGAAGLAVLAVAQAQWALLVAAALYGIGIAATQTNILALIVDRTDVSALGSAMATYTLAWDVGAVVGSVLLGIVVGATSYGAVFAMCALFPVAGLALFVLRVRQLPARTGAAERAGAAAGRRACHGASRRRDA